jgi:hypothetical protein
LPATFGPRARVAHLRVDESHGDAYTTWVAQGMPANPTEAQVAALRLAMAPASLAPDRSVEVAADGSVNVDFDLPRFGISLFTIVPDTERPASGCACRVADTLAAANPAAGLGLVALILMTILRGRRRAGVGR